jgi:hypothetical protein
MKTVSGRVIALILGVGILAFAANTFADQFFTSVSAPWGQSIVEGMVYNVPAGANVEWEVDASGPGGYAQIMLGGDLNVNVAAYGSGVRQYYDVTSTSGGNIYYYLHADASNTGQDGAYGMFWVGW